MTDPIKAQRKRVTESKADLIEHLVNNGLLPAEARRMVNRLLAKHREFVLAKRSMEMPDR